MTPSSPFRLAFRVLLVAMVTAAAPAATLFSKTDKLSLKAATPNVSTLPNYGLLELTLDLRATFENPFNPEEIDVYGLFTSPKGESIRVNGFLDQPFSRRLVEGKELIQSAGDSGWKIRFTPNLPGRWQYQVFSKDKTGTVSLPVQSFRVSDGSHAGFIRRSERNPYGFARDNGQPFFGVGENVCWGGGRGSFDYDVWLPELGKAGGNFIRIWMCSWNCALEWAKENRGEWRSGDYQGVGVYSLDNAWKLDTILDLAEREGVSVMLCLGTYGEFNDGGFFNEGQWRFNPYNVTNGGPCLKPDDFWTNADARKLYQQRLRYLAARYGHRTNLHSWEFWNEAKAPAAWVAEMARCFKGTGELAGKALDPYRHLVTTTYGDDAVWRIPEIDYTQNHSYGIADKADFAPVANQEAAAHRKYGKPHWLGEFGIDWRSPDDKYDKDGQGVNLHNAMWASVMSGDAGGGLIWWWDNYLHPKRLYPQFTPLRAFVDQVPWTRGEWKPLKIESLPQHSLNAYGITCNGMALVWIQNAAHNWKNVYEKIDIPEVKNIEVRLLDLPPGSYSAKWWDPYGGAPVAGQVDRGEGSVRLKIPSLLTDIAVQLSLEEDKKPAQQ